MKVIAEGISSKLTDAEKTAIRANIGLDKGVRDYQAYIGSILDKAILDLNFVKNEHKVYEAFGPTNKLITDAITTARNSTATYQGPIAIASAAINTPRIAYDPVTGSPLGLLAEETRTNLLLRSEEFDSVSWTKQAGATVAQNTSTAPDGASSADTLTTNNGVSLHQSVSTTIGTIYCQSIYIKAGTITRVMVRDDSGAGRHIVINPTTGAVTSTSGTLIGYGVENLLNGWFRAWFSYTADSATSRMNIRSDAENSATVILWGAQFEAGSFPSTYIPTTTIAFNRLFDGISRTIPLLSEITILVQATGEDAVTGINQALFTLSDGTSANRILIRRNNAGAGSGYVVASASAVQATFNSTMRTKNQINKYAFSCKTNLFIGAEDGVIISTDTAGIMPVNATQLSIGTGQGGVEPLNGKILRLVVIPRALTAAELQAVTL